MPSASMDVNTPQTNQQVDVKQSIADIQTATVAGIQQQKKPRARNKRKDGGDDGAKRRCVSTACIACRRRKSKCDGNTPACAACASVYNTECVYDPNSDHRRKGVYKKDIDNLKTRNSTLQTLIQAILNYPEDEVLALVKQIRTCESLDTVAESIIAKENGIDQEEEELLSSDQQDMPTATFEKQLSTKMGELRLEDGSTRYIGGTSNLLWAGAEEEDGLSAIASVDQYQQENPIVSWTTVTSDPELILHLINMYLTWHYTFFTTLSKNLFYRDFLLGKPPPGSRRKTEYCTPLLVNAMLALGCHFTSWPRARADEEDSATAGDHFFKEAKRLIMENDEHEKPRITTVQALALMSVREAGCGREAKGWVYSGMSFRMACDLGLNLDSGDLSSQDSGPDEQEDDARRITFWGCFLFDKCWSNYLGRLPQLPLTSTTVPKFEVFPIEESDIWSAYTDSGFSQAHAQPSRTRAVARQISALCEISGDLMLFFYNPLDMNKPKGKQAELKKLSEIHQRLETWRRELPKELEPREGGLPSILVMHMFFQILYIHLFRPFLKYSPATSPLPAHVSPRKLCTQAAASISKLLRLYKRSHGLRQICNIAVYIAHSACTIHLLNLPDKNARRDIIHGVKQLEEIAEGWLCARRTLGILNVLARKWKVELPEEAATVLARTEARWGPYGSADSPRSTASPRSHSDQHSIAAVTPPMQTYNQPIQTSTGQYFSPNVAPTTASLPNGSFMAVGAPLPENVHRHGSDKSLPPQSAAEFQLSRVPRHHQSPQASTPVTNPQRRSVDSTPTTGGSPSDLFTGVDAIIRDSQDWWLHDQSQLAVGFDNWNVSEGDIPWLNAQTAGSPTNALGGINGANGVINSYEAMNTYSEDW